MTMTNPEKDDALVVEGALTDAQFLAEMQDRAATPGTPLTHEQVFGRPQRGL
jgi:hypothetical protein